MELKVDLIQRKQRKEIENELSNVQGPMGSSLRPAFRHGIYIQWNIIQP